MQALRKLALNRGLSLEEVPEPGCVSEDEVLVRVAAAGVCGSDLHLHAGGAAYAHVAAYLPVTLGHEFCGHVVACGARARERVEEGALVAVLPGVACGACPACLQGHAAACERKQAIGVTRDGGFARYVAVPAANCVTLPASLDPSLGALLEPLGVGNSAVQVGEVGFGDTVVVLGPGTIGQCAARCAAWRGAACVIVVGMGDAARLAVALQVGATHVIDLAENPALAPAVRAITAGRPVDVVIEATGHPDSLQQGLELLRDGGTYVAAGIHARSAPLDLARVVRRRLQVRGTYSSQREDWQRLAQRLAGDPGAVSPMISLQADLAQALDVIDLCLQRTVSKAILRP